MTHNADFLLIITLCLAVSYGWGMRGTTIGGEKGAMLPGALIGLFTSMFCGVPLLYENCFVLCALGASGMYFGGGMTYGETLSFSMATRPAENMKKGLFALFVKGFLWFGVFGAVFSAGISFYFSQYEKSRFILLCICLPIAAFFGRFIFNTGHGKKHSKPKIYFSKTRQEHWGAMLGILFVFTVDAALFKNVFTLTYSYICALFGGFGWVIAQLFQVFSIHYAKDCKLLKFLKAGKSVSPWKIMECTLGFFGGLGAALGIIVTKPLLTDYLSGYAAFEAPENNYYLVFVVIWLVLLCVDMIHYAFFNKNADGDNKSVKKYLQLCEYFEPVLYAAFPMMMIFSKNALAARLTSFFLVFWVIVQEVCFEKLNGTKRSLCLKILFSAFGIAAVAIEVFNINPLSPFATLIMYGAFYELITLLWIFEKLFRKKKETAVPIFKQFINSEYITVHTYFCAVIVLVTILAAVFG